MISSGRRHRHAVCELCDSNSSVQNQFRKCSGLIKSIRNERINFFEVVGKNRSEKLLTVTTSAQSG